MIREFIEWGLFHHQVKSGEIPDAHLKQIQIDIMQLGGATISGTGGLKKIRSTAGVTGKSGGWRVIYADYPFYKVTVLIFAFKKVKKENLSKSECNELKVLKEQVDKIIANEYGN